MMTARQTIGNTIEGTEATLAFMNSWKDYYGTLPAIRSAALLIAGSQIDNDQAAQAAQLMRFVKECVVYQQDPVGSELIQSPDVMLAAIFDPAGNGTVAGDCDDHVILFVCLAESLGIACTIAGVKTPGSENYNHVIAVAHLEGRDVDVDLCAKTGWQPPYPDKLTV